jgi:hypothetical protein
MTEIDHEDKSNNNNAKTNMKQKDRLSQSKSNYK